MLSPIALQHSSSQLLLRMLIFIWIMMFHFHRRRRTTRSMLRAVPNVCFRDHFTSADGRGKCSRLVYSYRDVIVGLDLTIGFWRHLRTGSARLVHRSSSLACMWFVWRMNRMRMILVEVRGANETRYRKCDRKPSFMCSHNRMCRLP